jgi:hypothetical protein
MNSSKVTRRSALIIILALAGGGYALAQGKMPPTAGARQRPAASTSATKPDMKSCPMHDAAAFADATAENTADGAVIHLKAKKASDVQRVQEMASMMAKHMTEGCMENCDMEHGGMMHGGMMHGGMMHGGMQRHEPGPKPAQPSTPHNH